MKGIFLFLFFLGALIIAIVLSYNSCGSRNEQGAGLISILEKAEMMADNAKIRKIESAGAIYTIETGRRPGSVDDLVEGGYLEPSDIIDHYGNKLSLPSQSLEPGQSESGSNVVKRCGKCGNTVSASSKPGDTCPYCGVVWGYEKQEF